METIKVVIFPDDVNVICRLAELRDDEDNPICFLMKYPFRLSRQVSEDGKVSVRFEPWNYYCQDTEYRIPFSSVTSVGNAQRFIEEKYLETLTAFDPIFTSKYNEVPESNDQAQYFDLFKSDKEGDSE